jgi:hypothetical protein
MTEKTQEPYDVISDLKEFVEDIARFPNDDTFRFETDRDGAKAILATIANLRAALDVYADAANWEFRRQNAGHGDTFNVLCWKGPKEDQSYIGPSKGPEYARAALGRK